MHEMCPGGSATLVIVTRYIVAALPLRPSQSKEDIRNGGGGDGKKKMKEEAKDNSLSRARESFLKSQRGSEKNKIKKNFFKFFSAKKRGSNRVAKVYSFDL
jgi:hypothetical protein